MIHVHTHIITYIFCVSYARGGMYTRSTLPLAQAYAVLYVGCEPLGLAVSRSTTFNIVHTRYSIPAAARTVIPLVAAVYCMSANVPYYVVHGTVVVRSTELYQ